jgi:hypothetical protein
MTYSGEFQDFSYEIFNDCCKIHSCLDCNPHLCVREVLQETPNAAAWELQGGLAFVQSK